MASGHFWAAFVIPFCWHLYDRQASRVGSNEKFCGNGMYRVCSVQHDLPHAAGILRSLTANCHTCPHFKPIEAKLPGLWCRGCAFASANGHPIRSTKPTRKPPSEKRSQANCTSRRARLHGKAPPALLPSQGSKLSSGTSASGPALPRV